MLMTINTIFETDLSDLQLIKRGKVRDIYAVGDNKLLIVTTDRLSAFDVILPNPIPDKGKVLNQISLFWFERFKNILPNHIITADVQKMGLGDEIVQKHGPELEGRSILVLKTKPLPIEAVVRGFITGSGWKDYLKTGSVCGHRLPEGLKQCQELSKALFTPATKATEGHDENISTEQAANLIGKELSEKVASLTIQIYEEGRAYAKEKGILIADTKFEFGILDDELILIDEVLTPDSSRFWPKDKYETGRDQESFDKQIVRNYLETLDWNKEAPGPELPEDVVTKTSQAYKDVYKRLTGKSI